MRFSLFRRLRMNSPQGIWLEIFSIIVAIVLGFLVAEWREARAESQRSNLALQRIAQEVERNREAMERVQPYYEGILNQMDSIGTENLNVATDLTDWEGFNPIALQTSAYQIALQTGLLSNIDFEMATAISLYYAACEDFRSTADYAKQSLLLGQLQTAQQNYTLLELFRQHCGVLLNYTHHLQEDYLYAQ